MSNSWESFILEDKSGTQYKMSDYKLYIGKSDAGFWDEILVPDSSDITESVPGKDGSYFFNKTLSPRIIPIPCFSYEITENEKRQLQQLLYFTSPMKLIMERVPYRYINVLPYGQIDWESIWYGNFYNALTEMRFIAYDPLWQSYYSALDYDLNNDLVYDYHSIFNKGDVLRKDIPTCIHEDITDSYSFDLYNYGSYKTPVIFGIEGTGTSIQITNTTNSESFTLSSMSDENVLVDGKRGIITDAQIVDGEISGENLLKTASFANDFIYLNPGLNSFTMTGTDLNITKLQCLYNHRFL